MRTHATAETPLLFAAGALLSLLTAFALVTVGPAPAVALALVPLLAMAAAYLMTTGQAVLYGAAIALPALSLAIIAQPLVGTVVLQDVIAVLALGALLFATMLARGRLPPVPWTPVLGWPLVLFATAITISTLRGHFAYGVSLLGQPLRLFLYATIVAGLIGMTVPRLYRIVVALFYSGAVVIALTVLYYLAAGGSASHSSDLSTGGIRPLAISTSLYAAGALFLAMLNLRLASSSRDRVLHLCFAAIALFGVVAGFGRAAYLGVLIVGVVFLLASPRLRNSIGSLVPLALPFLVLLAIGVQFAAPQFVESVGARISASPTSDANVQWRVEATKAVLAQVREQPLFGVGFGKTTEIFLEVVDPTSQIPATQRVEIDQDPHNGYVYLLAGGGLVTLGAFLLLLGVFAVDAARRYRSTSDPIAKLLILWACATLFVFLLNAASGTSFASPINVLTIWALLVLPAVVTRPSDPSAVSR